jgi:hypothetical protein
MAVHGEAVLRARLCVSRACSALFFICSHCDRGQRYCSTACSSDARRRQHRAANQRYQSSPEGRLDHRDRQRPTVRDGSRFPNGHFSGTIRLWRSDRQADGGRGAQTGAAPAVLLPLWAPRPVCRSLPLHSTNEVS